MYKRFKIGIFILSLIAILATSIYVYMAYTKSADVNVSNIENASLLPIEDVIAMFKGDEEKANIAFIDKVIEVEGVIKEISYLNNRHTVILNSKSFTQSFVICDMSPLSKDKINKLTIGDTVILRGVCKGYLLDVIMLNCLPINEKTKE